MRDLVTHVYNKGHRKIAFIHGENTAVTRLRIVSFYKTCEELGISVPDEYVIPSSYHNPWQAG
jgi:DNA-binding LacI/PurR family transcriptional regulator